MFQLVDNTLPSTDACVALYDSVGWSTYTKDPESLMQALAKSTYVVTAVDSDALIGLCRVITDETTILYLQDILVDPAQHRRGVGRALVERVLERFAMVRQKILLTDDRPEQLAFYESLGFSNTTDLKRDRLNAFVRFEGQTLQ